MCTRRPYQKLAPIMATTPNIIQFIEVTYCHDIFPNNAHNEKPRNTTHSSKHSKQPDGKSTLSSLSQLALEELFTNN
jgi:hypothetical protein